MMRLRANRLKNIISLLLIAYFCIQIDPQQKLMQNNVSSQGIKNELKKIHSLPYPFSTIAEHDANNATFYGRLIKNRTSYFLSINTQTNEQKIISKFPKYEGWYRSTSALDTHNTLFLFVTTLNQQILLNSVNYSNSQDIHSVVLSHPVKAIEFNPLTGKLLGLARISRKEHFVVINPETGELDSQIELPFINGTHGVHLDVNKNEFLFLGNSNGKNHVFQIDLNNKNIKKLLGQDVGLNEYKIVNFSDEKEMQTLFTIGAQRCVDVAGYDPISKIGFIGHFTSKYKNIKQTLQEIAKKISNLNRDSNRGLQNMKIFVGGGVTFDKESVEQLRSVYTYLLENGIKYDEMLRFNTGVSHDLIIYNGELIIL